MKTIQHIINGDSKNPDSYVKTYDDQEREVSIIYGENPKDYRSYVNTYNDQGRLVSCIYGENPNDPYSWAE